MNIYTTSDRHLYINDHLIDLNQVIRWFNSKTWGGHNPHSNISRILKLTESIHSGDELTEELVINLFRHLVYLNVYGYYLDDVVFKGCPFPVCKDERNIKYDERFFRIEKNEYPRIDL